MAGMSISNVNSQFCCPAGTFSCRCKPQKRNQYSVVKELAGLNTPLSIFFPSVREAFGLAQNPSNQTAPVGTILLPADLDDKFPPALRVTT
jgi:hypothetical protein